MRNLLLLILLLLAALPARAFPQYHDISDTPAAQAEASQRHLPIAYLGSFPESLTNGSPETGSIDDLTQMALAALQDHAVVVFFDGRNMAPVPPLIHEQYHQQDDGPLDNGANWVSPKIVFCNADISKILGRVSYTQMKASRDVEINSALQVIRNDPHALDAPAPSAPAAAAVPAPNAPASPGAPAGAFGQRHLHRELG
ncbi:MAG: hypothetical protein WDO13_02155 [Verrucomicrobiota bacterium]